MDTSSRRLCTLEDVPDDLLALVLQFVNDTFWSEEGTPLLTVSKRWKVSLQPLISYC
jgi:hypothetical protein